MRAREMRNEEKLFEINYVNFNGFDQSGSYKKYAEYHKITSRSARSYIIIIPPLRGGIIRVDKYINK